MLLLGVMNKLRRFRYLIFFLVVGILLTPWAISLYKDEVRQANILRTATKTVPIWEKIDLSQSEARAIKTRRHKVWDQPQKVIAGSDVWLFKEVVIKKIDEKTTETKVQPELFQNNERVLELKDFWIESAVLFPCFDNVACLLWIEKSINRKTLFGKSPLGSILGFFYQISYTPFEEKILFKNTKYLMGWSPKSGLMNLEIPCDNKKIDLVDFHEDKVIVICQSEELYITNYFGK